MANEEWNIWAQEQNKKPGQHAQYYLSQDMPGGGTSSYRDPYYSSSEYLNSADSPYGEPTADYSTMWSSSAPNDILYSQGGDWNTLTEEALLGNTDLYNAYNKALTTPGAAQGAYTTFNTGLSQETQDALAALSGSKHSIAPDVGGEEELSKKLNQMWTAPAIGK